MLKWGLSSNVSPRAVSIISSYRFYLFNRKNKVQKVELVSMFVYELKFLNIGGFLPLQLLKSVCFLVNN